MPCKCVLTSRHRPPNINFIDPELFRIMLWLAPRKPLSTPAVRVPKRSEEHTSELQSLMRISYAVFCLKQKKHISINQLYSKTQNIKNYHIDTLKLKPPNNETQ